MPQERDALDNAVSWALIILQRQAHGLTVLSISKVRPRAPQSLRMFAVKTAVQF